MNKPAGIAQRERAGLTRETVTPEAFAELAGQHRPRVLRYATAFLGDRHLAEDVVQEALGRLFEQRGRYPLAELFGPYLVKTVARLCIDHRRSRQAEHRRITSLEPAVSTNPQAAAERREVGDRVAHSIAALPDRERACFLLTACEGLSYRDAAEALALTYAEVNNAVHRARTLLRATLADVVEGGR